MYFMSPVVASLAARHDLEVLQGTARSLATGCLPGGCRAMTHGGRLCGQLHQALAEPTQAQLLNIQVADMKGLLLRELTEDTAASRAQSAQGAQGAASEGQDLLSHRIPQRIPGAAWASVPKSI